MTHETQSPRAGDGIPTGFALVPIHPTDDMLNAGKRSLHGDYSRSPREKSGRMYAAMLAAAPTAPAVDARDEDDHWTLDRAVDLLKGYADHIRSVGGNNLQYWPYLPEVELVIEGLRKVAAAPAAAPAVTDDMCSAVRWAPSSAYWSERLREFFGPDSREGIDALERQLSEALAAAPAVSAPAWQPIETAPKDGRKLILAYVNSCGKARTVMARWLTDEEAEETDADGVGLVGGWYECIDNWEDYTEVAIHQGEPSRWMLPPTVPGFQAPATADGSQP